MLAVYLKFRGPFFEFDSADEYIASLRCDPSERTEYNILSITESYDSLAAFYDYEKPQGAIRVAQLFKFNDLIIFWNAARFRRERFRLNRRVENPLIINLENVN